MRQPDLILLHPPSVLGFRENPSFFGPVSDVVPSTSIFEIYPIGFLTISDYLERHGLSVRIVNVAGKMLRDRSFDPEKFIAKLNPAAFGIDLHWLPHADGSLSLAELIKKHHPSTPVILGGLSSTYYYQEIMRDYPAVDFVVRGDSTEEPLRMLVEAIKAGGPYEKIPNLVWREDDRPKINEFSFRPENLDYIRFDYPHLLRTALKYRDPSGYIPFRYWLTYPVTAVFQCRGCNRNCASCAGSAFSFKRLCNRNGACFRSAELLAADIREIAEYTGAPVMVIGDIFQAGEKYAETFFGEIRKAGITNELTIEFFLPPSDRLIRMAADSIENFNVEMSPESHDPKVRRAFGKDYENRAFERSLDTLVDAGCGRIDLFFMTGLPYQDYASVMETVEYCEELLKRFGRTRSVLPMIAPLAPFIDPGSSIFENPEQFGYTVFYRSLAEHRMAMLMPSWKYSLNYETKWMTRGDIVNATYDAALKLIAIKERYGIIEPVRAEILRRHVLRAKEIVRRIDCEGRVPEDLREEIIGINSLDSLCDKHELDWPIKGGRLKLMKTLKLVLE